jgi:signal transduction histidine kinase
MTANEGGSDRLRLWTGWRVDLAISVGLGIAQLLFTHFAAREQPDRMPLDAVAYALLASGPAALIVRRRYPVAVHAVVLGAALSYSVIGYPRGPIFLSLIVSFFTVVLTGHRMAAVLSLVVGFVSFLWLAALLGREPAPSLAEVLALGAWLLVLLFGAEFVRGRRERAAEAARIWAEEERRRASEERLRIARELHDVLAHNISLINVQAGVALHLMDERPEQARTALATIKEASKDALTEMRSVIDILRQDGEQAPRAPAATLARLDDLVSRTEAAGVRVETEIEGTSRPLPSGVDLAAFRIVQEALTNVGRHARAGTATVRVSYGDRDLTVQVDDDGSGSTSGGTGGSGKGILGMRERVAALGGELEAGPRPGGGFRVRARLPLEGGA